MWWLAASAEAGAWQTSTVTDAMTDARSTAAIATSDDGRAQMAVRCMAGKFDALVMLSRSVIHMQDGWTAVLVRVDGGDVGTYVSKAGADPDTAFIQDAVILSGVLARARQSILVRVPEVWSTYDNSKHDRDFSFPAGGAAAIDEARRACGLSPISQPQDEVTGALNADKFSDPAPILKAIDEKYP